MIVPIMASIILLRSMQVFCIKQVFSIIAVARAQVGDKYIQISSSLALLIVPIIRILVIKTPEMHTCVDALLLLKLL